MRARSVIACALALVLIGACTVLPTAAERVQSADALAAAQGWQRLSLVAGTFVVVAYVPERISPDETLAVYVEGDGLAWLTPALPSSDPTPSDPLALRLALAQPEGNAAYLARPCQYIDAQATGCPPRYWTGQRFAPELIAAAGLAVDALKQRFAAHRLTLVGYSGGGAVAALLAARRRDVERLVTVAGNLDHRSWTAHHRLSPLHGSLNAIDERAGLSALLQTHFVGGRDRVVPPALASAWGPELLGPQAHNLRILQDYDHRCCWAEKWAELWQRVRRQ